MHLYLMHLYLINLFLMSEKNLPHLNFKMRKNQDETSNIKVYMTDRIKDKNKMDKHKYLILNKYRKK